MRADGITRQEHVRIVESQLEISKSIDGYLKSGRDVLQMAQALGLPAGAVDAAARAVQAAEVLNGSFTDFITGDYLGAASGVVGLLTASMFGGGPDIATLRHQQIMEQFGVVNQKLDALVQGVDAILHGVETIDHRMTQLAQIVVAQHEEVMAQLSRIEDQVVFNTELLNEVLRRELSITKRFLSINGKTTYGEMEGFFNTHPEGFRAGLELISGWSSDIDPQVATGWAQLNPVLFARAHVKGNDAARLRLMDFIDDQVTGSLPMLAAVAGPGDGNGARRAWSAMTTPARTVEDVDAALAALATPEAASLKLVPMPYEKLDRPLSAEAVVEFAAVAASFSDFFFLVKWNATPVRLFTPQELLSADTFEAHDIQARADKARHALRFALALVNAAQAQRAARGCP